MYACVSMCACMLVCGVYGVFVSVVSVWCGLCVVWCGVVWRGVAWCGVAWRGVAWCGVAWRGVAWRGVAWCGVVCVYVITIKKKNKTIDIKIVYPINNLTKSNLPCTSKIQVT